MHIFYWLVVLSIKPQKIDVWCDMRNVEKAMAKINPKYFALSPVSICQATKFIFLSDPFYGSLMNNVH